MRILLMGDYSNVHWTLAEGLRQLGQDVTVVSDGDGWKNYRRDIDLRRKSLGTWDTLKYLFKTTRLISRLRGYDVVQLINPIFLDLRAGRIPHFYKRLRQHNGKLVMGAFGMDHYWVKAGMDCQTFRYSDFNIGNKRRDQEPQNIPFIRDWLDGEKTAVNQQIAEDADWIVSGLYEYDRSYRPYFADKLTYIPFPIDLNSVSTVETYSQGNPIRFFIGIQKGRSTYKGTDIMLRALERVKANHPEQVEIVKVESVPFEEYQHLMNSSHVMIDQLYSYTPSMNSLLAMAKGLIVVGGGEPENYEILGERELRPIINVVPDEEDVYQKLEDLVHHPERIPVLSAQSREYIQRHHDHVKVAKRYLQLYHQLGAAHA